MFFGIVGGIERNARNYERLARRYGHQAEVHSGRMAGRGSPALARLVSRSDVVLVLTDVNSHGAVICARKWARSSGRPLVLKDGLSLQSFRQILEAASQSSNRTPEPSAREDCRRCA